MRSSLQAAIILLLLKDYCFCQEHNFDKDRHRGSPSQESLDALRHLTARARVIARVRLIRLSPTKTGRVKLHVLCTLKGVRPGRVIRVAGVNEVGATAFTEYEKEAIIFANRSANHPNIWLLEPYGLKTVCSCSRQQGREANSDFLLCHLRC